MFGLFRRSENDLLSQLQLAYGLEWVESDVLMIRGSAVPNWWRGRISGERFGIRLLNPWEVYLGEIPSIMDLQLSRLGGKRVQPFEEVRIEDFVPRGHALALRFCATMVAHMDRRFHGGQLAITEVADGIAHMDEAVQRVTLYRSGIELNVDRKRWSRAAFDADMLRALRIVRGLEEYARQNPGFQNDDAD